MKILSFTTLWPNAMQPFHGLFVRERMKAVAKLCEVQVVAPVPWFVPVRFFGEQYYRYTQVRHHEKQNSLDVFHPRFLVLPKIGKFLDGPFLFYSLRHTVSHMQKEFPFELIDAHYAYPDGYAAGCLAKVLRIPYTITVRGSDITVLAKEKLRGALIRQSLMDASRIISVSGSLKTELINLGIPSEKVDVIGNGVDFQKFHPIPKATAREQLKLPQNAKIILSVGHLRELKGFHLLVDAIHALLEKNAEDPAPHLFLVGGKSPWEPSYQESLARKVREYDLNAHVSLVGPKKPNELPSWYAAADLFCLMSSREGCPNVVLESLACGTPVVATGVGAIPDMISKPDLGILVERTPESILRGLCEALKRIWDSEAIAQYAREQYSWEVTAQRVYQVFETVI